MGLFNSPEDRGISPEEELRLLAAVLEAAEDAIMLTDREPRIVWVNRALTELTGYGRDEVVGLHPRILFNSGMQDRSFYENLWTTILSGVAWRGEMINRRKDGTLYPEELSITPVAKERGEITHFVGIKHDLTQLKKLEAQYLQAQKMETVGRLAGGIAHDFNNLLTVIRGVAELAATRLPAHDPLQRNLGQILDAGDRAASLTRQLLAFSRKQILQPVPFDLAAFAHDWRGMLQRLIGERIEVRIEAPRESLWVTADPGQIEQVVMNLVVNAGDAMPEGGTLTLGVREVEAAPEGRDGEAAIEHSVMMTVRDTGVGMDEATQRQIFEPFFTTKSPETGTGLGLSTVYGIVQQSGGRIVVDSAPGRGTTFEVYLPRTPGPGAASRPTATVSRPTTGETILVVEDDPALRHLVEEILRPAGYTVLTASTGQEALEMMGSTLRPPDLLFSDVVLPTMSGQDLAQRVTERWPETRVLLTSGYMEDPNLREEVQELRTAFLAKPYTLNALLGAIREVLDGPLGAPKPDGQGQPGESR